MAKQTKTVTPVKKNAPRSLGLAERGIRTGKDFANVMSALMSDLLAGRVTPNIGNATCNAGGKLLKVVELEYKYGDRNGGSQKELVLAIGVGGASSQSDPSPGD